MDSKRWLGWDPKQAHSYSCAWEILQPAIGMLVMICALQQGATSWPKSYVGLSIPIPSMYGIFPCIWLICMVHVGRYTIHGWYKICFWNPLSFITRILHSLFQHHSIDRWLTLCLCKYVKQNLRKVCREHWAAYVSCDDQSFYPFNISCNLNAVGFDAQQPCR